MKELIGFVKKHALFIMFWLLIIIFVPQVVNYWIINNSIPGNSTDDGWASFFGSFLRGIVGGGATLVGVILTIEQNNKEQKLNEIRKSREIVQHSATIIYYDFKFAFDNINDFLFFFWRDRPGKTINKLESREDYDCFISKKNKLNQFYFVNDWISTVADLKYTKQLSTKELEQFTEEEIKKIYEIYGHLMNVLKFIDSNDDDVCDKAFYSMNNIVQISVVLRKEAIPEFSIKEDINNLMAHLKKWECQ